MDKFNNLIEESNKEIEIRLQERIRNYRDPKYLMDRQVKLNTRLKDPVESLIKKIIKQAEAEKESKKNKILEIENTPDFSGEFIVTVEWKRSRMWGSNPKSYTNYGFKSSSIGGCGYDKLSTAVAQALNSNKSLLKLLYEKKNDNLHEKNGDLLGYGSGYGLLPNFEDGVGTGSHERILKNMGLEMRSITSTNNTDVFLIRKKQADCK